MAVVDSLIGGMTLDAVVPPAGDRLRSVVHQAVSHAGYAGRGIERRREDRYPYPRLIRLSPVAADGVTPLGDCVVVVGKHLSPRGIDFFHREPLPHRRMVAWLETKGGATYPLLVELLWCRFTKEGWYDNGGRLIRVLELNVPLVAPGALAAS
jgi:hypothetical protein